MLRFRRRNLAAEELDAASAVARACVTHVRVWKSGWSVLGYKGNRTCLQGRVRVGSSAPAVLRRTKLQLHWVLLLLDNNLRRVEACNRLPASPPRVANSPFLMKGKLASRASWSYASSPPETKASSHCGSIFLGFKRDEQLRLLGENYRESLSAVWRAAQRRGVVLCLSASLT